MQIRSGLARSGLQKNLGRFLAGLALLWLVAPMETIQCAPLPPEGSDFFQLLASYHDDPLALQIHVTKKLRNLSPDRHPVEWIRYYAFYRITMEGGLSGDPLQLNTKLNFARDLALSLKLYPEYLSFYATDIRTDSHQQSESWKQTFQGLVKTAEATGDHRVVAEINRVYANVMSNVSIEDATALAQKGLQESLLDVRSGDILPYLIKKQIAGFMMELGNRETAKQHYLEILEFSKREAIRALEARVAGELGRIFRDEESKSGVLKAEQYFQESIAVAASISDLDDVILGQLQLVDTNLYFDRLDQAKSFLTMASKSLAPFPHHYFWSLFSQREAEYFLKAGKFTEAIASAEKALGKFSAEEFDSRAPLLKIKLKAMSRAKLFSTMESIVDEYSLTLDQIERSRLSRNIPQLQAKLGMGLEQQKSALLQRENELQQQTLKTAFAENRLKTWLVVSALLMSLFSIFGYLAIRKKNQEIQKLHGYIKNKVLQRFLPPEIVLQVMNGASELDEHPHSQLTTVLFADLVGFTQTTDAMQPDQVARILNSFMSNMTNLIFEKQGTIDKFIGDAIMVVFGAPNVMSPKEQAQKALNCGRAMQELLQTLNETWRKQEHCAFEMRIGIHQGVAIVGSFGNEKRSDYTVIGRTVNIASRIENQAKPGEMLFSESIALHLSETTVTRGIFELRGIEQPIELFSLPQRILQTA